MLSTLLVPLLNVRLSCYIILLLSDIVFLSVSYFFLVSRQDNFFYYKFFEGELCIAIQYP